MLLANIPSVFEDYIAWWVAALIVVVGLFIYGLRDVLRFSFRRAWAISGVSFDESIRRKVLWITPLAIIGTVIVTQLQNPIDAQDAIRQTIKFCLFATGLVVVVTAIILASTNLPKEIENRVIYTIVTKPTTRLEIVVGKVIGFARVSAAILLIMGVFMFAYLHLRAWSLQRDLRERLAAGQVEPLSRPTMEYYANTGLLGAASYLRPHDLQILSRVPDPAEPRLYTYGGGDESFAVPFDLTAEDLTPPGAPDAGPGAAGMYIKMNVGFMPNAMAERLGLTDTLPETIRSPTQPSTPTLRDALLSVQILDETFSTLISEPINQGRPVRLTDPSGTEPVGAPVPSDATASILQPGQTVTRIWVHVTGESPQAEYFVPIGPEQYPITLVIPPGATGEEARELLPAPYPDNPDRRMKVTFRGRIGTYGQQLRGGPEGEAPLAIVAFERDPRDPAVEPINGKVPFEMRVGIERSGEEEDDALTRIQVIAVNRDSGFVSEPVEIVPESTRTSHFLLPAEAVGEGNFDLRIRNLTRGNYIGLLSTSVNAVASEASFNWNLIKSLVILWLMAILVVIVAIFCSTFLSWPIAIVLTVVILLGHWTVLQLGDDAGPGVGRRIADEMFGSASDASAGKVKVVSESVEALTRLLRAISQVLPDISKFAAVEDIERGATISMQRLWDPLLVLATFGLPLLVLSYVILRNKEVAP